MTAARVSAVALMGLLAVVASAGILIVAQPIAAARATAPAPVTANSCTTFASVTAGEVLSKAFDIDLVDGDVVCVVDEPNASRSVYALVDGEPAQRLFGVTKYVADLTKIGLRATG